MTDTPQKNIHTISLLVANKPGVLVRIALVFARRGYNIDSLVVSPSFNEKFSRMTITAKGEPETLEQIIKQAKKLIDVIHVSEHDETHAMHSELALFKVKANATNVPIVTALTKKHKAKILDNTNGVLIIGQTGPTEKLNSFEAAIKKYQIIEMVRTGKVAMARGHEET